MTAIIDYPSQGSRIFITGWKSRLFPHRYAGNAEEICRQIVKDCWNGRFFQTSTTNFPQFWTRDFGWCTASLLKLGYQKEVQTTLRYALNRFVRHNKITTTITPGGKPFDFPCSAVDSLPWLVHSIRLAKFPYHSLKPFLNNQIALFVRQVVDPTTGLVKPNHLSSMKDLAVRKSSCYDNCMLGMLAKDLKALKLPNPLENYDYPDLIKRHFWSGRSFYDDIRQQDYVAGDANIYPFAVGLIGDTEMMNSAIAAIRAAGLDTPFPLKYTAGRKNIEFVWEELFLRNYESNALWTHMGPLYIKLVQRVNPALADEHKKRYTEWIEHYKNYLEVFTPKGKPFSTPFYYCDRGMLWAANYLTL